MFCWLLNGGAIPPVIASWLRLYASASAGKAEDARAKMVSLAVPPDRSILDVVRGVVPDAPYSCEEGYCGSCETRVLGGVPDHADDILSPEERAANDTMMICVSRSCDPNLVLDL